MTILIKKLNIENAHLVCSLYRDVYGNDFPVKSVYEPQVLYESNIRGDSVNILAFCDGELAGQAMVGRSPFNEGLFEMMGLIVLPQYRERGIADRLAEEITDRVLPERNWTVRYTESTTAHRGSQKVDLKMGHVHSALALNLLPKKAYDHDDLFNVSGRVSCIMSFAERKGLSDMVSYIPDLFYDQMKTIMSLFGGRTIVKDCGVPLGRCELVRYPFESAGSLYITATRLGEDFSDRLNELSGGDFSTEVLQIPAMPGVSDAVEAAVKEGFFLGGFLPRWFGKWDGVLLQRTEEIDWDGIKVLPGNGQNLLDIVRKSMEDRSFD